MTDKLITINTSIGKKLQKALGFIGKSCNFATETMEKSCKHA